MVEGLAFLVKPQPGKLSRHSVNVSEFTHAWIITFLEEHASRLPTLARVWDYAANDVGRSDIVTLRSEMEFVVQQIDDARRTDKGLQRLAKELRSLFTLLDNAAKNGWEIRVVGP